MKAVWRSSELPTTPAFLLALVFGGQVTPTLTNPNSPGEMDDYDVDDTQLIVDEGRRQLDNATSKFEHVQARAQTLLTVSLVALAFTTGGIARLADVSGPRFVIALVIATGATVLAVIGLGLAAAVIVVRADFEQIDTTRISNLEPPIRPAVARDYASSVRRGEITVAARVTAFRMATRYTVWGALLTAVVYLVTL